MSSNDHDSGRSRRRRRDLNEYDDAWAAAYEDDYYDDSAEIEDLAAGYVDDDPGRSDLDDFPTWAPPRQPRRSRGSLYNRRPTYYRDRTSRGEYGEYRADRQRIPAPSRAVAGFHLPIPYWQILVIVILVLAALFATALACISLLLI